MLVLGAHSPQFPKLAAGESSPTSPADFRQLDDVFLQTQTRIWLGEVLRSRLNEERSIADLLADGELLFEVAKEVSNMMLSKSPELKPYEYEPFASRNSGRYLPYSFVDSFLRMCKILGLGGIDLFSPSDVVEKGDTRKVCVCLRALSKKARSLDINVPDFDIVTNTIAMPTDMVGYIRRSWELSLSEYSSSSSLSQNQKLRQRSSQEHLNEECWRNDASGDSETNSMLQSDISTTGYSYNSSSDMSSKSIKAKNDCLDLCSETQVEGKSSQCQQEELSLRKLKGSFFLHRLDDDDDHEENVASSSVVDSNCRSSDSFLNVESGSGSNLMDPLYHDLNLDDKASVVEGSLQCSTPKSTITDDHQSVSAITVGTYTGDSGSCFPKKTSDGNENRSQFLDGDDVEVSSVGSVNSIFIDVRNLDFDDYSEIEQSSPETTSVNFDGISTEGADTGLIPHDKNNSKSNTNLNAGDEGKESVAVGSCFSQWDLKGKCRIALVPTGNVGCEALSQSPLLDSHQYIQGEIIGDKIDSIVVDNDKERSTMTDEHNQTNECSEIMADSSHKDLNVSCQNENTNKDEEAIEKLQKPSVKQTDDCTDGIVKRKRLKRPILKAVVSGTAVVGAAFLLLHFRFARYHKSGELGEKSNEVRSTNGRNLSSGKEQKARKADGVYPAEKLKL